METSNETDEVLKLTPNSDWNDTAYDTFCNAWQSAISSRLSAMVSAPSAIQEFERKEIEEATISLREKRRLECALADEKRLRISSQVALDEHMRKATSLECDRVAALDAVQEVESLRTTTENDTTKNDRPSQAIVTSMQADRYLKKLADIFLDIQKAAADHRTALEQAHGDKKKLGDELLRLQKELANNKKMMEVQKMTAAEDQEMLKLHKVALHGSMSEKVCLANKLDKVQKEQSDLRHKIASTEKELSELQVAYKTSQSSLLEEKEKSLCQICLESPKDTICLPCLHFHYCKGCLDRHRRRNRTCPCCRTILSGIITSDISMSGN